MTDVSALQSVAERLAKIANDCFDLSAVERLRHLVDELQSKSQTPRFILTGPKTGKIDAEGP